jgi:FKBP-type peptidyl-prolyl cis-trans isomerase
MPPTSNDTSFSSDANPNEASDIKSELRKDAHDLKDSAKHRAEDEAETRKDQATGAARSTSSAFRTVADDLEGDNQAPDWLTAGFRQAADGLAEMADAVEGKSAREIGNRTSRFARENPAAFLAGSAALGFTLARFLRAGAEHELHNSGQGVEKNYAPGQTPDGPTFSSSDRTNGPSSFSTPPRQTGEAR